MKPMPKQFDGSKAIYWSDCVHMCVHTLLREATGIPFPILYRAYIFQFPVHNTAYNNDNVTSCMWRWGNDCVPVGPLHGSIVSMLLRGQRNFNNIVWVHVRQRSYLSHPIVDTSETEQQLYAMLYSHFGSSSSSSSWEVELWATIYFHYIKLQRN